MNNVHALPGADLAAPVAIPTAPSFLDAGAKKEWKRITKELVALEMIATIDRALLAAYCVAWSRFEYAEEMIAKANQAHRDAGGDGTRGHVSTSSTQYQAPSVWVGMSRAAAMECAKLSIEFGGSAKSRAKVKAEDTKSLRRAKLASGAVTPAKPKGLAGLARRGA